MPSSWVGSNYTQELKDAGLSTPGKLLKQWDETVRRRRTDQEGSVVVLRARTAMKASTDRFPASSRT